MKKADLLLGVLIGFAATFIGIFLFFTLFTDFSFGEGIRNYEAFGYLGKIITIGAVMNLIAFFILLKINKEMMARGVVLATIILTVITLLV
ncbi:hypothetical protein NAT51_13445 [Flavobacterium amniphilum]|uniref:hypothetical protein n=1 Tax=Flavobacterium amniphilum TaxID=1834035 RepID=UPI00202A2675|nr:hypothetical protein [Flavobacterium amniphilum]MCL9806535.1 hypothetical protein [Flavobacterium amniphilum]